MSTLSSWNVACLLSEGKTSERQCLLVSFRVCLCVNVCMWSLCRELKPSGLAASFAYLVLTIINIYDRGLNWYEYWLWWVEWLCFQSAEEKWTQPFVWRTRTLANCHWPPLYVRWAPCVHGLSHGGHIWCTTQHYINDSLSWVRSCKSQEQQNQKTRRWCWAIMSAPFLVITSQSSADSFLFFLLPSTAAAQTEMCIYSWSAGLCLWQLSWWHLLA